MENPDSRNPENTEALERSPARLAEVVRRQQERIEALERRMVQVLDRLGDRRPPQTRQTYRGQNCPHCGRLNFTLHGSACSYCGKPPL